MVAVLPRNQAVELCRQCSDAAQRLVEAGLLPITVAHRIYDLQHDFPLFIVEEQASWGNRNFFSFHHRNDVMTAVLKTLPMKRNVIVYRIDEPFSFPPLNDFMGSIPHEHVGEDGDVKRIEKWLESKSVTGAFAVRRRSGA